MFGVYCCQRSRQDRLCCPIDSDEYLRIAMAEPDRVKIVDTSGSVEKTHSRVKEIIVPFLKSRGCRLLGSAEGRAEVTTGHC